MSDFDFSTHICSGITQASTPVGQKLSDYAKPLSGYMEPLSAAKINLGGIEGVPVVGTPKQYVPKTPRLIPLLDEADRCFMAGKVGEDKALALYRRARECLDEARAIIAE